MQRAIHSQAIRPTQKPRMSLRTETKDEHKLNDFSTDNMKDGFSQQDNRKQLTTNIKIQSSFKEHPFYNKEQDLASSFSFSEEEEQYQYEKLLFSKFIHSPRDKWITFLHQMSKIQQEQLVAIIKIGNHQENVYQNRIISHFIGIWLLSMGYQDPDNKKRIVTNVQYLFAQEKDKIGLVVQLIYDNLFYGYLPDNIQLQVLLQICKRGWEYFTFFLGRFINVIKRCKNIRQKSFLEEIQKII